MTPANMTHRQDEAAEQVAALTRAIRDEESTMKHFPDICLTLCGAALPVLLLAALTVARVARVLERGFYRD